MDYQIENLDWYDNITIDEISNDKKRGDFIRNENNWKIVWKNIHPMIIYSQLRGTKLIKITISRVKTLWGAHKHKLGSFFFNSHGDMEKSVTGYEHHVLLDRAKELRTKK